MILGEKHNLGKAVSEGASGFIEKPRPMFWEWLFLAKESPLKKMVADLSIEQSIINPLLAFPDLQFIYSDLENLKSFGAVEKLVVASMEVVEGINAYAVGGTLATASWFGLTDLHIENMLLGKRNDGSFAFCPINIECVFEKLELLSQTQLAGGKGAPFHQLGSTNLMQTSLNVAGVCVGFINSLSFYQKNQVSIDELLLGHPLTRKTPTRIVINATSDYVQCLRTGEYGDNMYAEELVQLNRGDVPYFFSYIGDDRLKYVGNDGGIVESTLNRKNFRILQSFYNAEKSTFERDIDSAWIKRAVCQICRTFDKGKNQTFHYEDSWIKYQDEFIFINLQQLGSIRCKRLSSLPSVA